MHIVDLVKQHAVNQANQISYSFLNNGEELSEELSYQALDQAARGIAAHLSNNLGISKGDRVILLFVPGLDFVRGLFACLYGGFIAVPVNPPATGQQSWANFLSIVENAGASLILADDSKAKFLDRQRLVTKQGPSAPIFDIADIDYSLADCYQDPASQPDDVALLQYTSGTTSIPKGVMVTHANIIHNLSIIEEQIYQGRRTTVSWLPIYHDMGLFGAVLESAYVGCQCVLMPPSSFLMKPVRWLKAIQRFGAEVSGGPNFAFELCVDAIEDSVRDELDLSCWKVAASGAEPVLAPTLRRFGKKFFKTGFNPSGFVPCYGLAESTLLACANKKDRSKPPVQIAVSQEQLSKGTIVLQSDGNDIKEFVSCGAPGPNEMAIVDVASGQALDEARVGEIWIRSPSVAQGYWNNPQQTAEVFGQSINGLSGYYRTGDLGFMLDGEIYISGRIKDLIIIRGKNHYPGDIEHTVQAVSEQLMPDSGAVFALEREGTERVVVLQEVKQSFVKSVDTKAMIESIERAVIEHHTIKPDAIMLLRPGRILKTSSGKIRRSACRDSYLAGQFDDESLAHWQSALLCRDVAAPSAGAHANGEGKKFSFADIDDKPAESIQAYLVERVAAAVGKPVGDIDPDIEFVLLGLDSVDAVDMMADLSDALGLDEDDPIWDCETLNDLATYIARSRATI